MPRLTISRLRRLIRALRYAVSVHAAEELEDDDLSILDLESVLLTGDIVERQRDRRTLEVKCRVRGLTREGDFAETIVKVGPTGHLFIITIYRA